MRNLFLAAALVSSAAQGHNGVPHEAGLPKATTDQIHVTAAAAARYRDFRVAEREGWKKFGGDEPLMGEHWYHPNGPDYQGSDAQLDFSRPSNLMYTTINGRRVLTGVTFNVRLLDGEALPEGFAGTADRWHAHDMLRAIEAALSDRPILRWFANEWLKANYFDKGDQRGRVAMLHVWVGVPNPDGVFADHNRTLPYLKMGLPASDAGSMDTAHGIDMATPNGCRELIDGRAWIANLSSRTTRSLHAICRREAAAIRADLASRPEQLNELAADAYKRFSRAWDANLTPAQRERVDAMTEHGNSHLDRHADHCDPYGSNAVPHALTRSLKQGPRAASPRAGGGDKGNAAKSILHRYGADFDKHSLTQLLSSSQRC